MPRAELKADGWWLRFDRGEEAGPFRSMEAAEAFLDYVDNVQQQIRAKADQGSPTATATGKSPEGPPRLNPFST